MPFNPKHGLIASLFALSTLRLAFGGILNSATPNLRTSISDVRMLSSDYLWTSRSSFSESRYGAELVHCMGMDTMFLIGGEDVNRLPINGVSVYDFDSNKWSSVESHPDSTAPNQTLWGSVVVLEGGPFVNAFDSEECVIALLPGQRSKDQEPTPLYTWVGRLRKLDGDKRIEIQWNVVSLWNSSGSSPAGRSALYQPSSRHHHTVSQHNGNVYMFGGQQWKGNKYVDLKDMWVLTFLNQELTHGTWKLIKQSFDLPWPSKRFGASSTMVTYANSHSQDTTDFVMYGGESTALARGVASYFNDMWYFDIVNEQWRSPHLASHSGIQFARTRSTMVGIGDMAVLFGGTARIPAGQILIDIVFDDVLVTSGGHSPRRECGDISDDAAKLWCALSADDRTSSSSPFDSSNISPLRRYSHASTVRRVLQPNSTNVERYEMIIAGGIGQSTKSYRRDTLEYVLADVWVLDVDNLLEKELVEGQENYGTNAFSAEEQSMYFFFGVLCLTVGMLCIAAFRGHSGEGIYWQSFSGFSTVPGARCADLKVLPLVYFEANPLPVVQEDAEGSGSKDTSASETKDSSPNVGNDIDAVAIMVGAHAVTPNNSVVTPDTTTLTESEHKESRKAEEENELETQEQIVFDFVADKEKMPESDSFERGEEGRGLEYASSIVHALTASNLAPPQPTESDKNACQNGSRENKRATPVSFMESPILAARKQTSGSVSTFATKPMLMRRTRGGSSMISPSKDLIRARQYVSESVASVGTRHQASDSVGIFPRFSAGSFRGSISRGSFGSFVGGRSFAARTLSRLKRSETVVDDEWKDQCSICLCEFEEGEQLMQLPCAHVFNPECIEQWLHKKPSCPLCKRKISDKESPSLGNLPKYKVVPQEKREWEPTPDVDEDPFAANPMIEMVPLGAGPAVLGGDANEQGAESTERQERPIGLSRFLNRWRVGRETSNNSTTVVGGE